MIAICKINDTFSLYTAFSYFRSDLNIPHEVIHYTIGIHLIKSNRFLKTRFLLFFICCLNDGEGEQKDEMKVKSYMVSNHYKRLLFPIIIVQMASSSFNLSSPTVVIIAPWSIIVISSPLVPVTRVRVPSGCVELRSERVHRPPLRLDCNNHHRQ